MPRRLARWPAGASRPTAKTLSTSRSCLAAGRLPTSYAPPIEVQSLRDLTRHRNGFSRQHARILHRVKSIMNANNRPGPARMQSDGLIRYLKAQGEKLPARHVEMLWQCVDALALAKNRASLFTFLDYDGVPWNNNNAEHAIKALALLRRDFGGVSTEKGIREYLILLSVCETCKYMGVDFLDFLRSGETDIYAFAAGTR